MSTIEIIGRNQEKEKLDKILHSNQAEFLALYGRRRVGKTFLIHQYLKEKIIFDLSGTKEGTNCLKKVPGRHGAVMLTKISH